MKELKFRMSFVIIHCDLYQRCKLHPIYCKWHFNALFLSYIILNRLKYESDAFRLYFCSSAVSGIAFIFHILYFLRSLVRGCLYSIRCQKLNLVLFHLWKAKCLHSIGLHIPIWWFWFGLAKDKCLVFVFLWTKQQRKAKSSELFTAST